MAILIIPYLFSFFSHNVEHNLNKKNEEFLLLKEELICLRQSSYLHKIKAICEKKAQLKEVKLEIEHYVDFIAIVTTIPINVFVKFVTEYLTMTEGELIKVSKFIQDYTFDQNDSISKLLRFLIIHWIDEEFLISNQASAKKVKKIFGEKSIEQAILESEIQNYILVSADMDVILADGVELSDKFRHFSSMQFVFERLIDLTLANPGMTIEEKLAVVLEEKKKQLGIGRKIYLKNGN